MKGAGTIRGQLTRKLLIAVTLAFTLGGLAIYFSTRTALQAQFDAMLETKAQALSNVIEQKNGIVEIDYADEYMTAFDAGGANLFELWLPDGTLLGHSQSLGKQQLGYIPSRAVRFWDLEISGGKQFRALQTRFQPHSDDNANTAAAAEAILIIASNSDEMDRMLLTLLCVLGGCGFFGIAATFLIVPRVLEHELIPLQRLAEQAGRIDAQNLSARFPTLNLPGELVPITARLNELLSRMQASFERERQFSSDVAHEFRTPVAELRAMAELATKLPESRSADFDKEILAIALHLEGVLTQLLTLARGEHNQLSIAQKSVALHELIENTSRRFIPRANERKIELDWRKVPNTTVLTDPVLLRTILANLIDNAVEYSRPGTSIQIDVNGKDDIFAIRVMNTVQELNEEDIRCMFERFWRKDSVRSPERHTGLGLSLARAFAAAIGCELTAGFVRKGELAMTLTSRRKI